MTLAERYAVGTKVGEFEGRPLFMYHATCPSCQTLRDFETRAVCDATKDAEIEVCGTCGTVTKYAQLN